MYKALSDLGYNVWYDKNNIAVGEEWEYAIRKGIRTTKKFIALISENIALESNDMDYHAYRTEWDIALAHRMKDGRFVMPVCLGSTDIYKNPDLKVPEDLLYINAVQWNDTESSEDFAAKLISSI